MKHIHEAALTHINGGIDGVSFSLAIKNAIDTAIGLSFIGGVAVSFCSVLGGYAVYQLYHHKEPANTNPST